MQDLTTLKHTKNQDLGLDYICLYVLYICVFVCVCAGVFALSYNMRQIYLYAKIKLHNTRFEIMFELSLSASQAALECS